MSDSWDEIFSPQAADDTGLVYVGGQWSENWLLAAYQRACFPWPLIRQPILWFSPDPRAIFHFPSMHWAKSFLKWYRKHPYQMTRNQAFPQVMQSCAQMKRPGQSGSWILPEMLPAYTELWKSGRALSVEVWNSEERLVGGIYGVLMPNYFSAESMFHLEPNTSKLALWELIHWLRDEWGWDWMDIQVLNSFTESLGGFEIPRETFLRKIGYT